MKRLACALLTVSSAAFGYDCNSDCSGKGYSYPCGVHGWPPETKYCHGDLPNDPVCMADKEASCVAWQHAVDYMTPRLKPYLVGEYNHQTWAAAEANGTQEGYMSGCVAAGGAACGAIGASVTGPWGAAITGALGAFVSFRVCQQSQAW